MLLFGESNLFAFRPYRDPQGTNDPFLVFLHCGPASWMYEAVRLFVPNIHEYLPSLCDAVFSNARCPCREWHRHQSIDEDGWRRDRPRPSGGQPLCVYMDDEFYYSE